jgi:hypothetical protein
MSPILYFCAMSGFEPYNVEEGRATSKSHHYKFGYFLSISQKKVSADIIQNSAVGKFSPKNRRNKDKSS